MKQIYFWIGELILLLLLISRGIFFFAQETDYSTEKTLFSGLITSRVQRHGYYQLFQVGGIKVKTSATYDLSKGDKVVLFGKAEERVITNFYSEYFLNYPKVRQIIPRESWSVSKLLVGVQKKIMAVFRQALAEPGAALLAGISFGLESDLPPKLYENFKKTGLLHIVVASGANVLVVAGLFKKWAQRRWSKKVAIIGGIILVWFYAGIVGFDPPVMRAAIMASLVFWASGSGRCYSGLQALFLTSVLMLFCNPALIFSLSFQLSVAATLGIMLAGKSLQNKGLGESIATTLSAQMLTTPLLAAYFGKIYPLSLLSNFLLLWLIDYIMIGGFLLAGMGVIFLPLANIFGGFFWLPIRFLQRSVNLLGSISWSWRPSYLFWAGYVLFCLTGIFFYQRRAKISQ